MVSPSKSAATEQPIGAKGHDLAANLHFPAAGIGGGGKPAPLVKLLVIGQERLGDQAQDPAAMQHRGAVEDLVIDQQRQTHHRHSGVGRSAGFQDLGQTFQGPVQKRGLVEQVGTGVAGQSQLGKDHDGHSLALRLAQQRDDLLGVEVTIGHAQHRAGGCYSEETEMRHG